MGACLGQYGTYMIISNTVHETQQWIWLIKSHLNIHPPQIPEWCLVSVCVQLLSSSAGERQSPETPLTLPLQSHPTLTLDVWGVWKYHLVSEGGREKREGERERVCLCVLGISRFSYFCSLLPQYACTMYVESNEGVNEKERGREEKGRKNSFYRWYMNIIWNFLCKQRNVIKRQILLYLKQESIKKKVRLIESSKTGHHFYWISLKLLCCITGWVQAHDNLRG